MGCTKIELTCTYSPSWPSKRAGTQKQDEGYDMYVLRPADALNVTHVLYDSTNIGISVTKAICFVLHEHQRESHWEVWRSYMAHAGCIFRFEKGLMVYAMTVCAAARVPATAHAAMHRHHCMVVCCTHLSWDVSVTAFMLSH